MTIWRVASVLADVPDPSPAVVGDPVHEFVSDGLLQLRVPRTARRVDLREREPALVLAGAVCAAGAAVERANDDVCRAFGRGHEARTERFDPREYVGEVRLLVLAPVRHPVERRPERYRDLAVD